MPLLGLERRGAKLVLPGATPELGARAAEAERAEAALAEAGYEPVPIVDARLAAFLEERGSAVRVGDGLALSRAAYDEARRLLVAECEAAGSITSPASATSSEPRAARRSCSSSASTQTGSRGGPATRASSRAARA